MLRRVISRERLDEGIFTSASAEGKTCQLACGIPCFFMCNFLVGLSIFIWLQTFHALSEQSTLVVEVPCSGDSARDTSARMPNVLHHFEDCVFKKNASTMMVGNYVWQGYDMCGHTARDMQTGALISGMRVSFIGNTSNGVLRPWMRTPAGTDVPIQICDFKEAAMSASLMIEKKRYEVNWVFIQRFLFIFIMLLWSSGCAFFPDGDLTHCNDSFDSGQNCRILMLAVIAAIMSCSCGALIYGLGRIGWYVFFAILVIFLAAGFSEILFEKSNTCCRRLSHADATPDEEEPLMPPSSEAILDPPDTPTEESQETPSTDVYQVIYTVVIGSALGILASILFIVAFHLMQKT